MDSGYALPITGRHGQSHSASILPRNTNKLGINTSRLSYIETSDENRRPENYEGVPLPHQKNVHSIHEHANSPLRSAVLMPTSQGHTHSHIHSLFNDKIGSPLRSSHNSLPPSDMDSHDHGHEKHVHSHICSQPRSHVHDDPHTPSCTQYDHSHKHISGMENRSMLSNILLTSTEIFPLLHSILLEKDSRRLLYFMSLNFCFMLVQAFYGYVTDSLGLLSDSIHMFFDCLALAMGLFAAVSSKWPPSPRFPYGFAKIESLSGFGNGVFLILISIEILIEAIERLAEGRETKRLNELLLVSSLGLAVNLVGMMAFGHHHHGHSHGGGNCSHGHAHGEQHKQSHNLERRGSRTPLYDSEYKQSNSISDPPIPMTTTLAGGHNHDHENQNMAGIYLHILADTMGSAAVILSTLLIRFVGWSGWDPVASCVIAVLIFLSSLPLVSSSAKQLLLTVPADTEYKLRNTLSEVSSLRGVASYSVPKFWIAEITEGEKDQIMGVIHLVSVKGADADDLRQRARQYLSDHGMDVVVQVDKEGEGKCWCGGDGTRTPTASTGSRFI